MKNANVWKYISNLIFRYGDVFWTMMDPIPIDPDIVARYANKTMAVVGYETNQVWLTVNT